MDHVPPFSPARRYTFQQKYLQNPTKTRRLQIWLFVVVVVAFFLCFSSKDSHDFPLKRNVFSLFFIKLSLSPKDYHTFCKLTVDCIVLVAADLMYSCKNNQISQGEFSLQHHYRDDSCKCCILLPAG